MSDQPKKLDAKSRNILQELEQCVGELGSEDLAPPGFEVHRERLSEETPARGFGTVPLVGDEEYFRFKGWLTELAEFDKPTAFSAVLEVWLDAHGIAWPKGVFTPDLATFGSGVPPRGLGPAARRLRDQGKTWGKVAQQLLPNKCKTPEGRRKASAKVRLAADAHRKGVRRELPIDGTVAALVWKMLAVTPERILEQEYRDMLHELEREAEDDPRRGKD